ncbi:WSC-domain-containing protein [Coprinopsis marcescibilis]|uniref:WSC-domain-containing protein n=1 Tax=Coprinopsis marcescibilis TaxID=230819 RepID=A0A5C3KFF8_COPMA|nr:WSC-domain-containing protein [Coprinopsis marcescibilis]
MYPVASVPASLEVRQSPSIKPTVGTWQFKGCYQDFGPRVLTFRFDVPAGNSAQRCTDICSSNGYGLAGLEYGTECWCDNYKPYGALRPNSECNTICPGDSSEYCGAGNRLVLYQNSAATPPSTSTCITWRDSFSFGNNILEAIPKTGSGPVTQLFSIPTNPFTDPIYYTIISTCPPGCVYTDYYNFGLVNNALTNYNNRPIAPVVGSSQAFIFRWPQDYPSHTGYCAKPNPISPDGPFIGKPLLSVNGNTNLWGLCPNTTASGRLDIVYSPVANHAHYDIDDCQDVYIQLAPYA